MDWSKLLAVNPYNDSYLTPNKDLVEVVRCKDCVWGCTKFEKGCEGCGRENQKVEIVCMAWGCIDTEPNGYCHHAKRKDEKGE